VGYKVVLTETCEEEAPHLITHVETIPAPMADGAVTPRVHRALEARALLPQIHVVDTGFLDAALLVASRRDYGVELLGPTRKDQRWQARAADGFGAEPFVVDWAQRRAVCPAGHASTEWVPRVDNRGNDSRYLRFSPSDCGPCPSRPQCTRSTAQHPRRSLAIRPQAQYAALRQRRDQEGGQDYAHEYARRAGIEGPLSQGVRRCGLRRSRYIGLTKTPLSHVVTAAALNFVRGGEWLAGTPRAKTRCSPFAVLMTRSVAS
jgi:transposase